MNAEKIATLRRVYSRYQWLLRIELSLYAGERIMLDGPASLLRGLLPTRGRLVLTTRRLVYMPMYPRFVPRWWPRLEVPLEDIESITRRSWLRGLWGGLPGLPVSRARLKSGETFTFQTLFAGYFRREVQRLIADEPTGRSG